MEQRPVAGDGAAGVERLQAGGGGGRGGDGGGGGVLVGRRGRPRCEVAGEGDADGVTVLEGDGGAEAVEQCGDVDAAAGEGDELVADGVQAAGAVAGVDGP